MRNHKNSYSKRIISLLENSKMSLRILLEEESDDDSKKADSGSKESAPAEDKPADDAAKSEGGSDELNDLFSDNSGGGSETPSGEEGGDIFAGGEEGEEGGEAAAGGEEKPVIDTQAEKKKAEKAIETAAQKAAETMYDVGGGAFDARANRTLEKNIFENSLKMKKIYENINKLVFKNVNLKNIVHNKLSLNKFVVNENKFFNQKVYKLLKESSLDDIINDKFWEENAAVDTLVDNAVELTKHFTDKIDIPALIINAVSVKFGKMAAEQEEPRYAEIFKQKLADFISEYTRAVVEELPEYENYPTEQFRLPNKPADIAGVGAKDGQ